MISQLNYFLHRSLKAERPFCSSCSKIKKKKRKKSRFYYNDKRLRLAEIFLSRLSSYCRSFAPYAFILAKFHSFDIKHIIENNTKIQSNARKIFQDV